MAITLTSAFLRELRKGNNRPTTIFEVTLDSGVRKFGTGQGNGFSDVEGVVVRHSTMQNKLDTQKGWSTRGRISFTISGKTLVQKLINSEYLKNRRVIRYDGFIADGFAYSDYAPSFDGKIVKWELDNNELKIFAVDDMYDCGQKIPAIAAGSNPDPATVDYRNTNILDVVLDLLKDKAGIDPGKVDTTGIEAERDLWFAGRIIDRRLHKSEKIDKLINELQLIGNFFVLHDGEKITVKSFNPPLPGQTVEKWTDTVNLKEDSISCESGYESLFYNRIEVHFDYDESGDDEPFINFESAVVAIDSDSITQWGEEKTLEIKDRWTKSRTYTYTSNITGIVVYHVSKNNPAGSTTGLITYNSTNETLQYTAPGGTIGEAVKVTKNGEYKILDSDATKSIRVVVTYGDLPVGNETDALTVTALGGLNHSIALAQNLLSRFRDPSVKVTAKVGINDVAYNSTFIKPTDLRDITTREVSEKGDLDWTDERCMLTSVRPNFGTMEIDVEFIETKFYLQYGFISPPGHTNDWDSASASEQEYAFVGDGSNQLGAGNDPGFYIRG
jgi:hypothetical protein